MAKRGLIPTMEEASRQNPQIQQDVAEQYRQAIESNPLSKAGKAFAETAKDKASADSYIAGQMKKALAGSDALWQDIHTNELKRAYEDVWGTGAADSYFGQFPLASPQTSPSNPADEYTDDWSSDWTMEEEFANRPNRPRQKPSVSPTASGSDDKTSIYFNPGNLGNVSYDKGNQFMDSSYKALAGEGGKYAGKYAGMYDALQSGDYDFWKDWATYSSDEFDPVIGARLFWQTYGNDYADLLGDDFSAFYNGGNWWNDEIMRKIYEAEVAKTPSYTEQFSKENDPTFMKDLIRDAGLFGDDAGELIRAYGLQGVWAPFEEAKKADPSLTFYDWVAAQEAGEGWDQLARDATDKTLRYIYGEDMFGPGITRDEWAPVADALYQDSYSDAFQGDNWYGDWWGKTPSEELAEKSPWLPDIDLTTLSPYSLSAIFGVR